MNYLRSFLLIIVAMYLAGCNPQLSKPGVAMFEFQYDGAQYGILSTTQSSNGDGNGNMLVKKQGDHVTMRAIDDDKNGTIDHIASGPLSVAEADAIYKAGIAIAQNQNKFKLTEHERMYTTYSPGYYYAYIIQTFITANKETYNKFFIIDQKSLVQTLLIDQGADGVLDVQDINEKYKDLYGHIIKEGMWDGKIELMDGKYIVGKQRVMAVY